MTATQNVNHWTIVRDKHEHGTLAIQDRTPGRPWSIVAYISGTGPQAHAVAQMIQAAPLMLRTLDDAKHTIVAIGDPFTGNDQNMLEEIRSVMKAATETTEPTA